MARLTVRYSLSTLLIMVLIVAISFNLGLRARQAKLDALEQKLAQTQAELDAAKTSLEMSRISEQVLHATVQLKECEEQFRLERAALEKEQPVADAESGKTDRKRQTIDGFIWSCIRVLLHKKAKTPAPQRPRRSKEPPGYFFDRQSPPNTAGFASMLGPPRLAHRRAWQM